MNFFFFFFFKGKHRKIIKYFYLQGSGFNRRKHYTSITKIMIVFSKYCFSNERVFQNDYELIYRTGVRYKTIIDIYSIIKALVVFLSIHHLFQQYFLGCMQNSVLVQKKRTCLQQFVNTNILISLDNVWHCVRKV